MHTASYDHVVLVIDDMTTNLPRFLTYKKTVIVTQRVEDVVPDSARRAGDKTCKKSKLQVIDNQLGEGILRRIL